MTLDELTRLALEEAAPAALCETARVEPDLRAPMRAAVLAVLQAVKRECVPEQIMSCPEWNDCVDEMHDRIDRLIKS